MGLATLDEARLAALLEAGRGLVAQLEVDAVLEELLRVACELTGARYAALGVLDDDRRELRRFVTRGIGTVERERIGDPPRGHGILGELIRRPAPLRLDDVSEHPRSYGFPAHHPPMHTFLGVPILLRGVAYGNLYLTEKAGGADFTDADENIVKLLASQAAVAIENARLYESTARWLTQLQSLNEIGNALVTEVELPRLLNLIARRLRELLDARFVAIWLPAADGSLRAEAADGDEADTLLGATATAGSKSAFVFARGRSERVDSLIDDPEAKEDLTRTLGVRSAIWTPLVARGETIGLLVAGDKRGFDSRFSDEDMRVAENFADRAAVAVDLRQRVARDALRRVVETQELERARLARELHDETAQALTSILLGLKRIEDGRGSDDLRAATGELRELVVAALQDVRRLAVELRPRALDDFGLVPALERLTGGVAEQAGLDVKLQSNLPEKRLPEEVETTLYRVVQEALVNVVKHARAKKVSVVVSQKDGAVAAIVEDDGQGFAPGDDPQGGIGLLGMRERVELVDGRLTVESTHGGGTTVVVEVPLRA